jgi:HD-like signal output (HDOD) protein
MDASSKDLERIITCDTALTANLLRLANSAECGLPSGVTTVRAAIMRLGQRAVRSVAVSLTIQGLLSGDGSASSFSAARYAKHSIAVGFLARYIFARRKQREAFETNWSPDEAFAAGLLHDLGHALLARVAPNVYSMVSTSAEAKFASVSEEFLQMYGRSLGALGAEAAQTWNLPRLFVPAIQHSESPIDAEEELIPIYCIHYADQLVKRADLTIERWSQQPSVDAMAQAEVALPDEEIEGALQTESYLQMAGGIAA